MDEIQLFDEFTWGPCEGKCGKLGEYVVDPYLQELYNEKCWMFLCEDCLQERRYDI